MVAPDPAPAGVDAATEPALEHLTIEWHSLLDLCAGLQGEDWRRPTDCPGWSVQDNVAHVATFERMLQGHQPPTHAADPAQAPHVKNDVGAMNERWVAFWRDRPSSELLDELRAVTHERLTELHDRPAEGWDEEALAASGQRLPYRDFIELRAFDCWAHEQDIRRAVGRPGHWSGPVPALALDRVAGAMAYVVGKKAAAPKGSSVVFRLRHQAERDVAVGMDERAALLADPPAEPTVVLAMTAECFMCLGLGRWDSSRVLATGEVQISGDPDLGRRVVHAMSFMI